MKEKKSEPILDVADLYVSFQTRNGEVQAVRGVNFTLNKGETLAIVGESGCGKSVTAQSIMRLIPEPPGKIKQGSIKLKGNDLTTYTEKQMRKVRGSDIGMIFQDPMTSLNPVLTIGEQISESLLKNPNLTKSEVEEKVIKILKLVGIANPKERLKQYPHQFSGGMRQRIMIAMALVNEPQVLIADEPTTALDVTIQAQIIDLFKDIQKRTGIAIILITHDLGLVAQIADRINVMYAGRVIESGQVKEIFYHPQHPYTKGLLKSVPRLNDDRNQPLIPIHGTPPDLLSPPKGCPFAKRCDYAMDVCIQYDPESTQVTKNHSVRCWLQDERAKKIQFPSDGPKIKLL
ncbi:ABC transporter ATP-binding protein [Halalkalibacter okhensis]|uniref:Peptide ABC transporter ATP-binding protein n=1 Tax=Halalkalibacter okhensis TaxID=333138 RepID=A0A0B0IDI7_9BACI|nr:ABC transporter ATP-binding protein [Halalkalibacter okhensis]KHF39340.1 peptide ABC transporter ATP-binding protein [Halalkalibacter okhensis]